MKEVGYVKILYYYIYICKVLTNMENIFKDIILTKTKLLVVCKWKSPHEINLFMVQLKLSLSNGGSNIVMSSRLRVIQNSITNSHCRKLKYSRSGRKKWKWVRIR